MVSVSISTRSIAIAASTAAALVARANGHGYMLIPETQFSGTATGAWSVQIDPPSGYESSDWNGNNAQSVTVWKELSSKNGFKDLKTLLDGDTSLYGAECGFSNPNGTPQPIPSTSTATFERAIQHVGPCEIWLDNTKVFSEDDCYSTYGNEDVSVKSVFPVDYSQCNNGGCSEMRFYWLAFQGVDGKTVWQTYKDCIPLSGGGSSTSTTSTETESEADTTTTTTTAPSTSTSSTTDSSSTTTTTTAPSTSTSDDTADTMGTVQPSTSSGSTSWGNWGNWGGNSGGGWSGGWGGRQLRA